jgi:hypothetical protein
MNFDNLNTHLVKVSRGFLYGFGAIASYFLLIYSSSLVQVLVGAAAGITVWDWYKKHQK